MRPFFDSSIEEEITWYFVDDDTPFLPFANVINSINWNGLNEYPSGPGEVLGAPRPWSNGAKPWTLPLGQPAGPQEFFEKGAPASAAGSLQRGLTGAPTSCSGLPPVQLGSFVFTGPLTQVGLGGVLFLDTITTTSQAFVEACAAAVAGAMPSTLKLTLFFEYTGPIEQFQKTIDEYRITDPAYTPPVVNIPGGWTSGVNTGTFRALLVAPASYTFPNGAGNELSLTQGWVLWDSLTDLVWADGSYNGTVLNPTNHIEVTPTIEIWDILNIPAP